MPEPTLKKLTGSPRLVVGDEAPAGSVNKFQFSPSAKLWVSTCERPFMSDVEPLSNWRRLVPTDD